MDKLVIALDANEDKKESTKTRFKIYDPCDPYDPLNAASFPNAEGLFRTAFRTAFRTIRHSWMLGMSVICFHLQFLI